MLFVGTFWSLDQDQSFVPYGDGQCALAWFCPFPALPYCKEKPALSGEGCQLLSVQGLVNDFWMAWQLYQLKKLYQVPAGGGPSAMLVLRTGSAIDPTLRGHVIGDSARTSCCLNRGDRRWSGPAEGQVNR